MQFALLGPLEVRDGDHAIQIARGKPRALLALLLLSPGRVVPVERLIDELWGETPPATAATALQVYVSGLRKALGEGTIATHEAGYAIQVAPEAVDVNRFEQLRAQARDAGAERAAALLAEALGIWRGPALADVPLPREAARLEELRLGATEERIDAELELGAHEELVPSSRGWCASIRSTSGCGGSRCWRCTGPGGRQTPWPRSRTRARPSSTRSASIRSPMLQELQHAILRQDASLARPSDRTAVATVLFLDLGVRGEVEATADKALAAAETVVPHALRIEPGLADALLAVFEDATEAVGAAIAVCDHLRGLTDAAARRAPASPPAM